MLFSYSSCSQSKGGEPCLGHKMNPSSCEMLTERGNTLCLPQCVDVLVTHLFSAFSLSLLCSPADKSETYSLWQVFISRYWFICVYMDKPGSIPYFFFRCHQIQCQVQTNNAQIHLSVLYDFATLSGALSFKHVGSYWKWNFIYFFKCLIYMFQIWKEKAQSFSWTAGQCNF